MHDVQWAPQGGSFCVIAGYMPAQVGHNGTCYMLSTFCCLHMRPQQLITGLLTLTMLWHVRHKSHIVRC